MGTKVSAAEQLRDLIERVERLKEERKAIGEDITDIFKGAKAQGWDPGAMKTVIKLRAMTPEDRRDSLSMVEVYMQALGMSDVGLSEMAAKFLADRQSAAAGAAPASGVDQGEHEFEAPTAAGVEEAEPAMPSIDSSALSLEDATRLGAKAAKDGRPVTANPFPPRDARRAAWDTAWCGAAGSDGMDIPAHLLSAKALEERAKAAADRAAEDAAHAEAQAARTEDLKGDPFEVARRLVVSHQKASASWLQRQMAVPYTDAAVLLDLLQRAGVVSAPDLNGRREVLAKPEGDDDAEG